MVGSKRLNIFFFFILFIFSQITQTASLHLSVKSVHGGGLQKIGLSKPFILEVTVHGISDMYAEPHIEGIQQLHKTGIQSRTINGDTTIIHTYRAVCDTPGRQKIGPAVLQRGNMRVVSNILELPVEEYEQVEKGYRGLNGNKKRSLISAELTVDKRDVYEEEKIVARVRAYVNDSISIQSISCPSLDKQFIIGKIADPIMGKELINGELCSYVEWSWNLYPRVSGSYAIPPFFIDYQEQIVPTWGNFFGMSDGKKQISTNAIILSVKEVPNRDELDGVAAISSASLTITPSHAHVGEGMILTLQFNGDESVENFKTPLLKDMPKTVRWYYSNAILSDGKKRSIEYVVQGLEDGIITIPRQQYKIFNPEIKQVIEVNTDSITITVDAKQQGELQDLQKDLLENQQGSVLLNSASQDICDYCFIIQSGEYRELLFREPMRWWIFFILMAFPLIFLLSIKIKIIDYLRKIVHSRRYMVKKVCKKMNKRLKEAERRVDYAELYSLFILFFADIKTVLADETISTDDELLVRAGLKGEEYKKWQEFFDHIIACSFDSKNNIHRSPDQIKALFVLAHEWVGRISRRLMS